MSGLMHYLYALGMIAIFFLIKKYDRTYIKSPDDTADHYIVLMPSILKKVYMMIFVIGMILYGSFLVLYIKNVSGITKGHLRFALTFAALGIAVVFLASRWKVEVIESKMKIRPLFKKTITIDISEIERVRIGRKAEIAIYHSGRKIITVDALCINYDKLCDTFFEYDKL